MDRSARPKAYEKAYDVLVVGAGPAGAALTAALAEVGLRVAVLTPVAPDVVWPNTYGIWRDELTEPGLSDYLAYRWTDCVVYAGGRVFDLHREYGLFDNVRLQAHLVDRCERGDVTWHVEGAAHVEHRSAGSRVTTRRGRGLSARVVVDASGHRPAFVRRPGAGAVAFQAAYGIVGRFSTAPVRARQFVLMDYRSDHLPPQDRHGPATFLYAMDLGDGRHFVEETSLAAAPALPFDLLEARLHRRLAFMGSGVTSVDHVERCLFPMNQPLPFLDQAVLGYGGAASMVHPASGYQVGAALRRARSVAAAIAGALDAPTTSPAQAAQAGWRALWPAPELHKRAIYDFGLRTLLRFDAELLSAFFGEFFRLPFPMWSGYLSNTLTAGQIVRSMTHLFLRAPTRVRLALMQGALRDGGSLLRAFWY